MLNVGIYEDHIQRLIIFCCHGINLKIQSREENQVFQLIVSLLQIKS